MGEKVKELTNDELVSVYHLVLEHLELLENEKNKLGEEENERESGE